MSVVAPAYSSGDYFADPTRHGEDAVFKATCCLDLLGRVASEERIRFESYIDVGCGSGDAVQLVASGLRGAGHMLQSVKGYDVSPHVSALSATGIEFVCADFTQSSEHVDLVTLFDVFEHVQDPIGFLKRVATKSKYCAFHIPLDDSWNVALRDLFRPNLKKPGHLIALNTASALNILAFAGLRVLDYEYTFAFRAPSGHRTLLMKGIYPLRALIAKISPYLLSRTLGGASLLVIAQTTLV
jgi:SAM-dependent methyltransferase